jgi:hypothetical protein
MKLTQLRKKLSKLVLVFLIVLAILYSINIFFIGAFQHKALNDEIRFNDSLRKP